MPQLSSTLSLPRLAFNDITLTPVIHQSRPWIRATELARALGYCDESKISRLFRRNAEEFTPEMTQVVDISEEAQNGLLGNTGRCRIFSLRGCHLLAMFARTPVAKAFRRWVLDVLDKLDTEQRAATAPQAPTAPRSVTPSTTEDRKPLRALVGSWAQISGQPFAACWNQLKAAFNVADIRELPQEWMSDAIDWVQKHIDALPAAPNQSTALPAAPSVPAPDDDVEGHLAAIREHVRHIYRHEEALFRMGRKALPPIRKPQDMFSPARHRGLAVFSSMEKSFGALDSSLRVMEATTRAMLAMR